MIIVGDWNLKGGVCGYMLLYALDLLRTIHARCMCLRIGGL